MDKNLILGSRADEKRDLERTKSSKNRTSRYHTASDFSKEQIKVRATKILIQGSKV